MDPKDCRANRTKPPRYRKPKYLNDFIDHDGRWRGYYRRKGERVPLAGPRYSPAFWTEYHRVHEEFESTPNAPAGRGRVAPGTLKALIASYIESSKFTVSLKPATQRVRLNEFNNFFGDYMDLPVKGLTHKHVQALIDDKAKQHPGAANVLRKRLRMLMKRAIAQGLRKDDPTADVDHVEYKKKPHRAWQEEHIALFQARHPPGTMARRAFELFLWTAQRLGDVRGMGPYHVRGGRIWVTQEKTDTELKIKISKDLAAEIADVPPDQPTFLLNSYGKPFASSKAFGNWFEDRCEEAGVSLRAHGLRKAACRRGAEIGLSPNMIEAYSGHKEHRSVLDTYTADANQMAMADEAIRRLEQEFATTPRAAAGSETEQNIAETRTRIGKLAQKFATSRR